MTSTESREKPEEPFDHVPRSILTFYRRLAILKERFQNRVTDLMTWQILHLNYFTLDK
jgi:hypothetical protein